MPGHVIAISVIEYCLAAVLVLLSVLSFMRRGPLLSTSYLIADRTERSRMKPAANYRAAGLVYALLALAFLLLGLSSHFGLEYLTYAAAVLAIFSAVAAFALPSLRGGKGRH